MGWDGMGCLSVGARIAGRRMGFFASVSWNTSVVSLVVVVGWDGMEWSVVITGALLCCLGLGSWGGDGMGWDEVGGMGWDGDVGQMWDRTDGRTDGRHVVRCEMCVCVCMMTVISQVRLGA